MSFDVLISKNVVGHPQDADVHFERAVAGVLRPRRGELLEQPRGWLRQAS
jgi:hypothetical protein